MKTNLKALASLALALAVTAGNAQTAASGTAGSNAIPKKRTRRAAKPEGPSVQSQIDALRTEMQGQIQGLQQQLSAKDAQLQQAQQAAAAAQAAAEQAQQAAQQAQQVNTENTQAVSSLQGAVTDLKTNNASLTQSVQNTQKAVTAAENPDEIRFKGITLSPTGSFIEAATAYRSAGTGGGINTPFTAIPLAFSDAAQLSEFYGSGRQSRLALKATGKLDNMTMTGYYEMDWLGTGITSNNNQSNSYVLRMRQLWAQAALNNGWTFTGGQMWSLATETGSGLSNGSEVLPSTIDPQYAAGFVWTRQYGFRVTKNFHNTLWLGASAENAEMLNPAGSSLPLNLVIGEGGTGGGLYNSTANYSFNLAPDILAKAAWEPGQGKYGHYELFGLARFYRDRVYPNASAAPPTGTTTLTGTAAGAYNDSTVGGGIGASGRITTLFEKKLTLGLKGLYGDGTGRYGSSGIADVTLRPTGQLAPLHNFSALGTVEVHPGQRLTMYLNYGGDYVFRDYFGKVGYGSRLTSMSGCHTEPVPGGAAVNGGSGYSPSTPANCGNQTKDVTEVIAGYWYDIYRGPKGRLRQGMQYSYFQRNLWSGVGGVTNPGNGAEGTDNLWETSFRYYLP